MIKKAIINLLIFCLGISSFALSAKEQSLESAILENDLPTVKNLIKGGVNVNITFNESGITPLIRAASLGHLAIVKELIESGSNKDAKIKTNGHTALTLAKLFGKQEVVNLLLESGATDFQSLLSKGIAQNDRAEVLMGRGEYLGAIEIYENSLKIFLKVESYDRQVLTLIGLVNAHRLLEKYDVALDFITQAISTVTQHIKTDKQLILGTFNDSAGSICDLKGDYSKALEYHKKAVNIFLDANIKDQTLGMAYWNAANSLSSLHDYEKAGTYFTTAAPILESYGKDLLKVSFFGQWSRNTLDLGNTEEAFKLAYRGFELAREKSMSREQMLACTYYLADAYSARKDFENAVKYYQMAVFLLKNQGNSVYSEEIHKKKNDYFFCNNSLIAANIMANRVVPAFDASENSRSPLLIYKICSKMGKKTFKHRPSKSIQKTLDKDVLVVALNGGTHIFNFSQTVMSHNGISSRMLDYEDFNTEILTRYKSLTDKIQKKHPYAFIKSALPSRSNNALFFYIMKEYFKLLANPHLTEMDREKRDFIAKGLYKVFFNDIEGMMEGKKKLLFIPSAQFNFLPFETLLSPNGKYLVERFDITYTPSLNVSFLLKERSYKGNIPMLALGGAIYDATTYEVEMKYSTQQIANLKLRNANIVAEDDDAQVLDINLLLGKGWSNLPSTLTEVKAIGKIVKGSEVISGKKAQASLIMDFSRSGKLRNFKVLHFATHGLSLPFDGMSSLLLGISESSDKIGFLNSYEIENLDLQANFINLSACETTVGKLSESEGSYGLHQAFLVAGAKGVNASLWSVADESTMHFMIGLYEAVDKDGIGYDTALSEMKRRFISGDLKINGDPEATRGIKVVGNTQKTYSDPYYWAPFVYWGQQ
jgi:CHAT domain-containing protein/tetratricopeptide (TPR) repeat protein